MTRVRLVFLIAGLAAILGWAGALPAAAQAPLGQADIQRLQDSVYNASSEIAQLRSRDPQLASQLQGDLDNLRDEVAYLKVKLRKDGNVPQAEYTDVRDRLENLRARARGDLSQPQAPSAVPAQQTQGGTVPPASGQKPLPPPPPPSQSPTPTTGTQVPTRTSGSSVEVPVGTQLDVRLEGHLSSGTNQPEDRFNATTMADLLSNNRVLIPAGSTVRGVVAAVQKATRTDRKGTMTLSFDQIAINGRAYPIHATVTQQPESEGVRGEAGKIGAGAAIGGIIGGIIGGVKGALAGILIGGGGTMIATPGKDVDLPPGTVLRLRLDSPLDLPVR